MADETKVHAMDQETWLRCYTAALTGVVSSFEPFAYDPDGVAELCGRTADSALKEIHRRRADPEYKMFFVGGGR